jgi:hypothetical protein
MQATSGWRCDDVTEQSFAGGFCEWVLPRRPHSEENDACANQVRILLLVSGAPTMAKIRSKLSGNSGARRIAVNARARRVFVSPLDYRSRVRLIGRVNFSNPSSFLTHQRVALGLELLPKKTLRGSALVVRSAIASRIRRWDVIPSRAATAATRACISSIRLMVVMSVAAQRNFL